MSDDIQRLNARLDKQMLDDALATAVPADTFVSPSAAQQATALLRSQLRVEGDSIKTPTGQAAAEYVNDQLSKPEYKHFIRASVQRGGISRASGHQPPSAIPVDTPEPRTMGEAMIENARRAIQDRQSRSPISAGTNMRVPFGLRPTR